MPDRARYAREKARDAAQGTTPYLRRIEHGLELGLSRAQAEGHARRAGQRLPSQLFAQQRWVVSFPAEPGELATLATTRPNAVRAGRVDRMLRELLEGDLTPDEWRALTRRMRPIEGRRVLSDPDLALALALSVESGDWIFESPKARARRGRRS
jgi:hypothetical protein